MEIIYPLPHSAAPVQHTDCHGNKSNNTFIPVRIMQQQAAERSFCSGRLNLLKLQIAYCRSVPWALNVGQVSLLACGCHIVYLFVRGGVLKFKTPITCVSASIPT
jgi:hypothetical protein